MEKIIKYKMLKMKPFEQSMQSCEFLAERRKPNQQTSQKKSPILHQFIDMPILCYRN